MRRLWPTTWLILAAGTLTGTGVAAAEPAASPRDSRELPIYRIPNLPENGEAYYAPDGVHVIAQVTDPDAQDPGKGKVGGALTYTFTDTGKDIRRINDHGMDAFSPDGRRMVFTRSEPGSHALYSYVMDFATWKAP